LPAIVKESQVEIVDVGAQLKARKTSYLMR